MYIKKIIKIFVIVCLPFCIQIFASGRNKMRVVKEVVVDHQDENMYVTDEAIRRTIFKDPQAQHPMGLLRLNEIEKLLDNNVMIEKSEVFCTIDGTLNAKIKQREPIARVYDGAGVYYMDTQGKKMPLSSSYSARVPILRGNTEQYWQSSYALMQFIQNDQWMAENITEVLVKPNGEYEFLMRVPTFKVVFGKFEDEALNEYSVVNLKYMNQVVCRR